MTDLLGLEFVRMALGASLLMGLALSILGVYVVLRRIIFLGAALAQLSAAGVAVSLFAAGVVGAWGASGAAEFLEHHPETTAIALTLVGSALLGIRPQRIALPSEGVIGIGYALASGLAILVIAKTPGGEGDTLLLLYGNILAVTPTEMVELAILCPAVVVLNVLFQRKFLMLSLNPEIARAAGVRTWAWNGLLYAMIGFLIATAIQVAGSLLAFTYLVVPALTGVMLGRKTWHVTAVAVGVAFVGTIVGILGSVAWDLPSGPTVVAVLIVEALVAWIVASCFR